MRAIPILIASAAMAGLVTTAIAQDEVDEGPFAGLDPLGKCLKVAEIRYERCATERSEDTAECVAEQRKANAQCYDLHR